MTTMTTMTYVPPGIDPTNNVFFIPNTEMATVNPVTTIVAPTVRSSTAYTVPVGAVNTSSSYTIPTTTSSYTYSAPLAPLAPIGATYATSVYPNVSQTFVTPPKVNEIHINELLPFQVTPTQTIHKWIVRTDTAYRGQLARYMLLSWRPESLDYGSDVDTTTLPQVFLFPSKTEAEAHQRRLYNDYPELNLQAYELRVPVRITTHLFNGASMIPRDAMVIPDVTGYGVPSVVVPATPITPDYAAALPPELTGQPAFATSAIKPSQIAVPIHSTAKPASRHSRSSKAKSSRARGHGSRKSSR